LSVLAMKDKDPFTAVLHFGIGDLAERLRREVRLFDYEEPVLLGVDFDARDERQRAVAAVIHFSALDGEAGIVQAVLADHDAIRTFIETNQMNKEQPMVRMNLRKIIEWRDSDAISEKDFRILTAINSALGDKAFVSL